MTLYACCQHCEHDDSELAPDRHTRPCEHGCNDELSPLEAADIAWERTHPDPYASWVNGEPPATHDGPEGSQQ